MDVTTATGNLNSIAKRRYNGGYVIPGVLVKVLSTVPLLPTCLPRSASLLMAKPKLSSRNKPHDPNLENLPTKERIKLAQKYLAQCIKPNHSAAARKFGVPSWTLWRRDTKGTVSVLESSMKHHLMSNEQKNVLADWAKHLGKEGRPATRLTLIVKAEQLCGKCPCRRWVNGFK